MDIESEVVLIKQESPEEDETTDACPKESEDPQNHRVSSKPGDANDFSDVADSSSGLPVETAGQPEDATDVKVQWMDEGEEEEHEDAAADPLSGPVTVKEEPASDDDMETVVSRSTDVTRTKAFETAEERKMFNIVPLARDELSSKTSCVPRARDESSIKIEVIKEEPIENLVNEVAEEVGNEDFARPSRMTSGAGTTTASPCGYSLKDDFSDRLEPCSCDKCSYSCKKHNKLRKRMKSRSAEKRYFCGLCESRFRSSYDLKRHMRIHTGERPFACDVCDAKFKDTGHLANHKKTHTGEKPFVCYICESRFARSYVLEIHMRIHSGERPYKCELCNSRFIQVGHLQRHMQTHTGEKLSSCSVCTASFKHAGALKTHARTHTGEMRGCQ